MESVEFKGHEPESRADILGSDPLTLTPFLSHVTCGLGEPEARQERMKGSLEVTWMRLGG